VRDHLWRFSGAARFVSGDGRVDDPGVAMTDAVFETVVRSLLSVSSATAEMLQSAGQLLRSAPGTVKLHAVELYGQVEGSVDWASTLDRQLETGDETLFVCRFGRRRFETPAARLVRTALSMAEGVGRGLTSDSSEVGTHRRALTDQIHHLGSHPKLIGVRPYKHPSEEQLNRASERPGCAPIVSYIRFIRDVEARDPRAVARLFDEVVIAPASDDRLFELQVGFRLVEALTSVGWVVELLQAVSGTRLPFARLTRGSSAIAIWQQRALASLPVKVGSSRYSEYRRMNGLGPSGLIPDYVIQHDGGLTLVEVKLTSRDVSQGVMGHVRAGMSDAMAYLHDYPSLADGPNPRAVVVAWGTTAIPDPSATVAVSGLDRLPFLANQF